MTEIRDWRYHTRFLFYEVENFGDQIIGDSIYSGAVIDSDDGSVAVAVAVVFGRIRFVHFPDGHRPESH